MILSGNKNTAGLLIFITGCMLRISSSLIVVNSDENVLYDTKMDLNYKLRESRKTRDTNNCGQWSPWKNENHPSPSSKEDHESFSQSELDNFCPFGTVNKFECKDNNGEAFSSNRTAGDLTYYLICYDIHVGVICKQLDSKLTKCPDMSMRYQCSCTNGHHSRITAAPLSVLTAPIVTTITTGAPVSSSSAAAAAAAAAGAVAGAAASIGTVAPATNKASSANKLTDGTLQNVQTTLDLGGLSIPWWVFVLTVSGILFIISLCVSVCLYRKATNQLDMNRKSHSVHPLQSV